MYRKILVPLDGSKLAGGVLPYVRYLASGLKTPVELLFVDDPAAFAPYTARIAGRDFLPQIASSLSGVSDVRIEIKTGNAARVIIEQASVEPETLAVMATHGYSGAARWLLGSVAEKVAHELPTDLMIVRSPSADTNGAAALKTLLVPLDHSTAAEKVLPTVVELAQLLKVEALLIHVTRHVYAGPPDAFVPVFGAMTNLKEVWEQDTAEAERYLRAKANQLRSEGLSRVSTRALSAGVDGAAGEIIDCAEKLPDSLIVMTPQGQSGFERLLLGSVTKRVVQHSKKPVLVVRSAKRPKA
jgi:nucleotide-binding universal stress UspA family protein